MRAPERSEVRCSAAWGNYYWTKLRPLALARSSLKLRRVVDAACPGSGASEGPSSWLPPPPKTKAGLGRSQARFN